MSEQEDLISTLRLEQEISFKKMIMMYEYEHLSIRRNDDCFDQMNKLFNVNFKNSELNFQEYDNVVDLDQRDLISKIYIEALWIEYIHFDENVDF